MEIREVHIEEYWPLIVKNIEEFGQIAVAENEEFNRITKCIYEVLGNSFIKESNEYGVGRWEKMLGLTATSDMTLDDRKAAVLTRLSVKLPYTVRVLKQMLIGLLGEDNFTFVIDNDTQKITIGLGLSTTQSQIDGVKELIERVLPSNLVTEMEWIDGLPIDYTHVEYLESDSNQHINLGFKMTNEHSVTCTYTPLSFNWINGYYGVNDSFNFYASYDYNASWGRRCYAFIGEKSVGGQQSKVNTQLGQTYTSYLSATRFKVDGVIDQQIEGVSEFVTNKTCSLFKFEASNGAWWTCGAVRIHAFRAEKNGVTVCEVVPALDPTGAPCMYDIVTHKPFYNLRTGDFIYPEKETEATTYSLRKPRMYAQMTEHGIRRLYHVPAGYNGTKEEYAEQNGFKILVETQQPEEGYWSPVWHEHEDCIELEWVEVEPPVEEEVIENE